MRIFILVLALCLNACVHKGAIGFNGQDLFPLKASQGMSNTYSPFVAQYKFSEKSEKTYILLVLDKALRLGDVEVVVEASHALIDHEVSHVAVSPASSKASHKSSYKASLEMLANVLSWLVASGYNEEAEAIITVAIEKMPQDLAINALYAEILSSQGKEEQAVALLEDFVKKNPKNSEVQIELAFLYLKLDLFQKSYDAFKNIPLTQYNARIYYYIGFASSRLNKNEEAKKYFNLCLKENPDFLEAVLELGQIEEKEKNYAKALQYYTKVMDIDSSNEELALRIIKLNLILKKDKEALRFAQNFDASLNFMVHTIALFLENKQANLAEEYLSTMEKTYSPLEEVRYLQGALAYEAFKDYEKSLNFLEEVPSTSRFYDKSLEVQLQISIEKGQFEKALELFQEAEKAFPENINFKTHHYQVLIFMKRYEEALPIMEALIQLDSENTNIISEYAYVYDELGRYDEALAIMEKVLEKESENANVLNYIGYSLAEKGKDLDRALELLEKAYALEPASYHISDSLAWLYYKLERYEEAWTYINKAVSLARKDSIHLDVLFEHYGDIALALKKYNEARTAWQEAYKIKPSKELEVKIKSLISIQ